MNQEKKKTEEQEIVDPEKSGKNFDLKEIVERKKIQNKVLKIMIDSINKENKQ